MNIYAQRLLNVALALRESPRPAAFDMGQYGYDEEELHPCGTPACALGHYAVRQDLQSSFRLVMDGVKGINSDWYIDYDEAAILEHFGIDVDEAGDIFGGYGCGRAETAVAAAEFIEAFVACKWPIDPAVTKLKSELVTDAPTRELVHV